MNETLNSPIIIVAEVLLPAAAAILLFYLFQKNRAKYQWMGVYISFLFIQYLLLFMVSWNLSPLATIAIPACISWLAFRYVAKLSLIKSLIATVSYGFLAVLFVEVALSLLIGPFG